MKKLLIIFSNIIIALFLLSIFGWMVHHITKGDKSFGFLTKPVKELYSFPDLFKQTVKEAKSLPKTFMSTPKNFKSINKLEKNLIVLTAYSDTNNSRTIDLVNLKNDEVLHRWKIKKADEPHHRTFNPIMYNDKSLCYGFADYSGVIKIDSMSNVIWKQTKLRPHHSMNFDADSNLWVCSISLIWKNDACYTIYKKKVEYKDNYITLLNSETGDIMFHKSISEILKENNMYYYLIKSAKPHDPVHINDIQPALKTTKYYKKDDVFISCRNISCVFHYRPSTNKIINVIEGAFASQHDVDFYNDSTLVIFNNNYYESSNPGKSWTPDSAFIFNGGLVYSNIVRYDMWNDSISYLEEETFRKNYIFTFSEGLQEYLDSTTVFIEEQNNGVLWMLKDSEVIYKNVRKSEVPGYHHLPNWTRIIEY